MKSRYLFLNKILVCVLLVILASCKKLVEVDAPVTSTNSANVYSTDATAIAALTGIYTSISGSSFPAGSISSMSLFPGLSADELTMYSGVSNPVIQAFYSNALTNAVPGAGDFFWNKFYSVIYDANSAIEGLNGSGSLTPAVKQQLLGEALFMRAFCYFYLTNLYGDVPMPLSSDYKVSASLARTAQKQVYTQIIKDLIRAKPLLNNNYVDATALTTTTERTRPNQWVAAALLARVYLYTGDNANAIAQSTALIANTSLFSLSTFGNAFLKASLGNNEAIWQLQPVYGGNTHNTQDGLFFILPASGPNGSANFAYLSRFLLKSFEPGDQRRTNWVDSVRTGGTTYYYPYKYKINNPTTAVAEYEMVFRLAEQYLIRAEAEAGNKDAVDAVADLNVIRNRAGLKAYAGATDNASLMAAILHERQVELFTEWGSRWLDLKRSGTINSVMGSPGGVCAAKGGTWNPDWALYPVPVTEIQHDPNLTQNQGY